MKCSLRHALWFLKLAAIGTTLLVVPLRAATIETMASMSQPLPTYPQVRLSNGTFYGTTFGGFNGSSDRGSVFQLAPNGSLMTIYQFQGSTPEEANPTILIGAADGNLYDIMTTCYSRAPRGARIQAIAILLDRGWGKPAQMHAGEDDKDIRVTIRKIC